MNRRSATWVLRILLLTAAIACAVAVTPVVAGAEQPRASGSGASVAAGAHVDGVEDPANDGPNSTVPTDTANPFLPEERDLTDCLGLLQRPGCGSEARGGVGQTLVAILMIGGLLLIFGRIAWGIRRNRQRQEPPPDGADAGGRTPQEDSSSP